MNNNSLHFARASGHALATRNPLIAERAGRAAQALPAVLAVPTATGHYTTWSRGPAYCDTRPRSRSRRGAGRRRLAVTWGGFRREYPVQPEAYSRPAGACRSDAKDRRVLRQAPAVSAARHAGRHDGAWLSGAAARRAISAAAGLPGPPPPRRPELTGRRCAH